MYTQALFINHRLGGTGTFGPLRWSPEEVQFPVLSLDLQLEMAAH